jgi:hypothetical protein
MIIKNTASEIGDIIRIETDIPLLGIIALSSFIDVTVGEVINKTFKKSFRYSIDGVTWSQLLDLNNTNISNIIVQSNDYFYAEYLYERIGTDTTGVLEFDSVTINGQYIQSIDGPAYIASNFNNYFNLNNTCSIAWSVNVLEKLYKKGIIPEYIERNLSSDNATDRDYLDFWRGITHYFALYVCLARQFQFFYQNKSLLLEFVKQRGLFVCDDIEYVDLIYLMEFYYDEISQRGTDRVFMPKAIDTSIDGSKQVDGEYLRLICYDKRDEFIRNINDNKHIGWNIGNSSPLYKGLEDRLNVNKYYIDYVEDIQNIKEDLSLLDSSIPYILIHSDSDSRSNSNSHSNSDDRSSDTDAIIIINPGNGNSAGIGKGDRRIVINPNIDYEVTFLVKAIGDSTPRINFGVKAYDVNDNQVLLYRTDTSVVVASVNEFLTDVTLNQKNKYYFVRGILFNKNNYKNYDSTKSYQPNTIIKYAGSSYKSKRIVPINGTIINGGVIDSTPGVTHLTSPYFWDFWQLLTDHEVAQSYLTTLGNGINLSLTDGVVKIDPYIYYDSNNNNNSELYIYNLRVQPLSTTYSKGFIGTTNLLEIWSTNNNQGISNDDVEKDTKKFLIPYNSILETNYIATEVNK